MIKKNLGTMYFCESFAIQAPKNKLIAKKWSQNIKRKASLENIEYRPSNPLYNSKLSKKFFDDTRKILGYCSILNKNELTKTDILKDILIFARLNVLQFYEANNIKNAERLSKKINTILRKIK